MIFYAAQHKMMYVLFIAGKYAAALTSSSYYRV